MELCRSKVLETLMLSSLMSVSQGISVESCRSKVLETLMLSDGVTAQLHVSGVNVVGEWDNVMSVRLPSRP